MRWEYVEDPPPFVPKERKCGYVDRWPEKPDPEDVLHEILQVTMEAMLVVPDPDERAQLFRLP